jgi:hypothetical protein
MAVLLFQIKGAKSVAGILTGCFNILAEKK